jgi:hypothetical protein
MGKRNIQASKRFERMTYGDGKMHDQSLGRLILR